MTAARLRLVPFGPSALAALAETVAAAKAGDPLAPVTVVPPGVYAGLSARRRLARRGGAVNVRFMPLARVAELLGAARLAADGRRPVTPAARAEAVRAALADDPGAFAEVAGSAATIDALDGAFAELDGLREEALGAIASKSHRASEIVRLFHASRSGLGGFYDRADLASAAAVAVAEGAGALRDLGAVVLHLPARVGAADAALVDALARASLLWVVLGLTGERSTDAPARAVATRLTPALGEPAEEAPLEQPAAHHVVVAPTPEEEIRVALRHALELARGGTPLHRVALVSPAPEPYTTAAADVLAEAGIPAHGPSPHRLADTVAGRALLGALTLPAGGFARHDVIAWLHSAPVVGTDGAPPPVERWDRRSRQAGVTSGPLRWRQRLGSLAERLDARRAEAEADGDPAGAERLGSAAAETRSLAAFVDGLVARLRHPAEPSWSAWGKWARQILSRSLGGDAAHASWPDHEIEALRQVETALDGLQLLDTLGTRPDPATFRQAVERELAAPAPRRAHFGDGVFVGRIADLVGVDVDAVFVLGMAEGALPSRPGPGLLTDAEREAAGGALPASGDRRLDERRTWLAALAHAGRRTLLAPSADPREGRPRHASPWLLDAAAALGGEVEVIRSPEDGLRNAREPVSLGERDLVDLLGAHDRGDDLATHPLALHVPDLAAGISAVVARSGAPGPGVGPWQGVVGRLPAPGWGPVGERHLSPTSLEQWATCPARYFFGHVLRIDERDDPEDIETLSALDRGRLVHEILDELVREVAPGAEPGRPWGPEVHARLDEIADEHFTAWEDRGRTGRALLWRLEQRRLRRLLHRFLEVDGARRQEMGVHPVATELAFRDGDALEVPLANGATVRLRGCIDRVDAAPDGSRLRVLDYKTGQPISTSLTGDPFESDRFLGGTKLQLAAYALAARRRFGDVPTRAEYVYLSERWRFKAEGYEVGDDVATEFVELLSGIVDGIEAGVFPANPGDDAYRPSAGGDTYENCFTCAYDRICPADRAEAWERIRSDGALAPYLRVRGAS